MNSFILYSKACELCSETPSNPREKLLDDIASTSGRKRFKEPISRIELNGNYSQELIIQVFSELSVKVTRSTNEYGRTIVYFEDASDSSK